MIQSPKNIYLSSIRLGLIRLTRYCKLGPLFIKEFTSILSPERPSDCLELHLKLMLHLINQITILQTFCRYGLTGTERF